ncbi:MAG TPA: alpha/beta hydrolase [Azonexus sp.]
MDRSPSRRHSGAFWLAATLAATALWTRQRGRQAERRFPPQGRFIEVDGVRLHYLDQGAGPAVLLVHGNGSRAEDFAGCGLIDALRSRYRVVAIDRPGFGYSERPRDRLWTPKTQARLLAQACQALDIDNPVVLGHSFGTEVALALALHTTLPVRGLLLASGYYFPTFRPDALLFSPPAIPLLGDVLRYTLSPLLGKLLAPHLKRKAFSPKPTNSDFSAAVPTPLMLRPWQLKASAEDSAFMVPGARELSRFYREIAIPVEIFAGSGDKIVRPEEQSARLHAMIPHSRLHLMPDDGHMLHYGHREALVAAIDRLAAGRNQEKVPEPAPGTAEHSDIHHA